MVLVCILFSYGNVSADSYKGQEVPSKELLSSYLISYINYLSKDNKNTRKHLHLEDYRIEIKFQNIGKVEEIDNNLYRVPYTYTVEGDGITTTSARNEIVPKTKNASLKRLDSGSWVLKIDNEEPRVLQNPAPKNWKE
jgi:hypothetical protein